MTMTTDPRIQAIDNFTSTTHHKIPSYLQPALHPLPPNTTICIIGSSSGIGEHIAHAYAAAGAGRVILAARNIGALEAVAAKIRSDSSLSSPTVDVVECDIASSSSVANLAQQIGSGGLDILVLASGYAPPVTLRMDHGEPADFAKAFETNAIGTYHVIHYVVPILVSSGSSMKQFFVVGSIAACLRRGPIANTAYCVSKMAQARLVELAHEQFAQQDLLVVNVHPGAVMTDMARGNTPDEFMPYLVDEVGLCGAFCVYLSTREKSEVEWLGGRLVSANWDVKELLNLEVRERVVKGDLLKFGMYT